VSQETVRLPPLVLTRITQFLDHPSLILRTFPILTSYSSDASTRHEPQHSPPNQLSTAVKWRVEERAAPEPRGQNLASKPDPGEHTSAPSRGIPWNIGNSDVHEIERGTSHITLHQSDTPVSLVADVGSLRSNTRKRTGPDSSPAEGPAAPAPHHISRDDQSPKRSRPQSAAPARRFLAQIDRGNVSGS
jgi:hypothetical protein